MADYIKEPNWKEETSSIYSDDNENAVTDSAAVRSEIDATRQRLSTHLDQLQARFQPENLKQQTQNAVENALTDSVDTVKDYVNEYVNDYVHQVNWNEVRDNVFDTVRRNPIPTALIGVGLGWMLLGGSHSRSNGKSNLQGNASQYRHGLGWREETPEMESPNAAALRHANRQSSVNGSQTKQMQSDSGHATSVNTTSVNNTSVNNTQRQSSDWQSSDPSIMEQLKDGVVETASQVRDGAQKATSSLYQQASNVGTQLQQSASQVAESASEMAEQWQETGEAASHWSQDKVSSLGDYTQRTLDENPLMFGAVALIVGAGLGMLLPATRYETEAFADLRQQAVDKASEAVEEVKDRAQVVIDELQPGIAKAATSVVENVETVGKQAVSDIRQSLQSASEKLEQTTDSKTSIASKSSDHESIAL